MRRSPSIRPAGAPIGRNAGEQLKGADRLENRHAAAVDDTAAAAGRRAHKLGFQRKINDLGNPVARLEQRNVERRFGQHLRLLKRKPAQPAALAVFRLPAPTHPFVKQDYNRKIRVPARVLGETGRLERRRIEQDPELFLDLTNQRKRRRFALFHLAAREFPQSAVLFP